MNVKKTQKPIPPELQAQIDWLNQTMLAFKEAAMTAVLTAAHDCNVDPDFAIGLAAEWLQEEQDKDPVCGICDTKRKRCRGCKRKVACQCSDTPNLCRECEIIVNNVEKLA
jgi:hypothetical protein